MGGSVATSTVILVAHIMSEQRSGTCSDDRHVEIAGLSSSVKVAIDWRCKNPGSFRSLVRARGPGGVIQPI